jgi:hypothetical protein
MSLQAPVFSEAVKQEIIRKVEQLTDRKCPMGPHSNWLVMDGYSTVPVQPNTIQTVLGGAQLPCATLVCRECGYVVQFALGILGLLKEQP